MGWMAPMGSAGQRWCASIASHKTGLRQSTEIKLRALQGWNVFYRNRTSCTRPQLSSQYLALPDLCSWVTTTAPWLLALARALFIESSNMFKSKRLLRRCQVQNLFNWSWFYSKLAMSWLAQLLRCKTTLHL